MRLAEGLSFVKGQDGKVFEMAGSQVADITCKDLELGDGTYRFVVYSATLQQLQGGRLMTVNLKADDATALGNYTVTIGNVALSDLEGHVSKEDGVTVGVKVTNYFTLLYMVDGEYYNSHDVEYGAIVYPEPASKEGHTFSGWSEIPETMPAHDVMVTGKFTVNKYVLIYLLDGKEYKTLEVDYGSTIVPEAEPAPKEGYTFSGWEGLPETMPAQIVIATGTYTVNKYKLTYMIGNETYKEVEIEYGSTIPTEPQPDGDYVRFEWVGVPETMPAHDVIVYADFETGITDVMALQGVRCIYSPNGKRISKLQKGVNIVVMSNGSIKKVYVK